MRKKLYKFEKFKLLLEKGNDKKKKKDDGEFNFDDFDLGDSDEEMDEPDDGNSDSDKDESDFSEDDDFESEEEDNFDDNEEEEEEEEPVEKVFNEDPSYYTEEALKKVERKLTALFEVEEEPDENGRTDKDQSSYQNQGVELMDVKTTGMPMNKTLIMKYHDNDFSYQLLVTVGIQQGIPEKEDVEMDHDMIEFAGVKFKKYDVDNNLLGELDRKKVKLDSIDQDFLDSLNGEMDSKYSIDDNFEIEYKDKDTDRG
jgi:hypothetical protein